MRIETPELRASKSYSVGDTSPQAAAMFFGVGALLVAVGIAAVFWVSHDRGAIARAKADWTRVDSVVVATPSKTASGSKRYFRFTTAEGRVVTTHAAYGAEVSGMGPGVGDHVTGWYDPADPRRAYFDVSGTQWTMWLFAAMFLGFGLLAIVAGIVNVWRRRRS